jgi:hypothetical protein
MLDRHADLKAKLNQLFDRTTLDAVALLLTESKPDKLLSESPPDWMTASQLARYWQLVNSDDEPTTAGIMKWAKRRDDEHPLPHAYMGDLLRFNREEVDLWAREEAERRRAQSEKRKLKLA